MKNLIKKSVGASLVISMGAFGLLYTNYSIFSIILFAFGLISVCLLDFNLFTGKCGFVFENKEFLNLSIILLVNIIASYIFGLMYRVVSPDIIILANEKVASWSISWSFFLKSCLCGAIMYLVVKIYKKYKNIVGICFGIPLFIMCSFQHSIANATIMGAAGTWSNAILICILGNWAGSLFVAAVDKS